MTTQQKEMLDSLKSLDGELNDWEESFVENLDDAWRNRRLSTLQANKLVEIYDRYCIERRITDDDRAPLSSDFF